LEVGATAPDDPRHVYIQAPTYLDTLGEDTTLVKNLLELIEARPGLSTSGIEKTKPGGGVTAIRTELRLLEADGKVRSEAGPRRSTLWYPLAPSPSDPVWSRQTGSR
jgi:hypothetical protein